MAVSCVLLGSSQSSSKKSSGGTNGPYHRVRMRNWRNPGSSGQICPPWPNRLPPPTPRRSKDASSPAATGWPTCSAGAASAPSTPVTTATSGEAVAVKVFSRGEGLAPRADREARTARKLDHPNIHEVVGVAPRRRSRLPDLPAGRRRAVRPQRPDRRPGGARDRRRLRRPRARPRARGRPPRRQAREHPGVDGRHRAPDRLRHRPRRGRPRADRRRARCWGRCPTWRPSRRRASAPPAPRTCGRPA